MHEKQTHTFRDKQVNIKGFLGVTNMHVKLLCAAFCVESSAQLCPRKVLVYHHLLTVEQKGKRVFAQSQVWVLTPLNSGNTFQGHNLKCFCALLALYELV